MHMVQQCSQKKQTKVRWRCYKLMGEFRRQR